MLAGEFEVTALPNLSNPADREREREREREDGVRAVYVRGQGRGYVDIFIHT